MPDVSFFQGAAQALARVTMLALVVAALLAVRSYAAVPPSIEDFASRALIEGASISSDGRYLATLRTLEGKGYAAVIDRQPGKEGMRAVLAEPAQFQLTWCRWATNTRLLCSLHGIAAGRGVVYPVTRLVAVDADGKNLRVLLQNSQETQGQYQDRIINWAPGPSDTVLIEADEGLSRSQISSGARIAGNVGTHGLPAVFELNVRTGELKLRQHARDPIRHWITDKQGQVRLAWGLSGTTTSYWARLDGDSELRRLTKFEIFAREDHFEPVAISEEDPNWAYAMGPSEGRKSIWLIDLKDKADPQLVFSHPLVDVSEPIIGRDGLLVGARYDDGYPMIYYADHRIEGVIRGVEKLTPGPFITPVAPTLDQKVVLLRAVSDVDAPSFMILDTETHQVSKLGAAYPDRDDTTLAPMQSTSFRARDGTRIPAYLSVPPAVPASHLPLIVMPHGGPIARDTWGYFFLREFLVSRGYAVLQMNFRGSSGYGADWFFAAHQDWGGLSYDDVLDGARWAVEQGTADPERVCIVGWSFGGYLALLGAQRNPELFHCAVDIAGVSDLPMLIEEGHHWIGGSDYRKKQIGTDTEKLKRDSPRLHVEDLKVPLIILQGKKDFQVPFEQSESLDTALTRAGKPHRFVVFPDADHQFSEVKDRAALLREIESFLMEHLPVAASSVR